MIRMLNATEWGRVRMYCQRSTIEKLAGDEDLPRRLARAARGDPDFPGRIGPAVMIEALRLAKDCPSAEAVETAIADQWPRWYPPKRK